MTTANARRRFPDTHAAVGAPQRRGCARKGPQARSRSLARTPAPRPRPPAAATHPTPCLQSPWSAEAARWPTCWRCGGCGSGTQGTRLASSLRLRTAAPRRPAGTRRAPQTRWRSPGSDGKGACSAGARTRACARPQSPRVRSSTRASGCVPASHHRALAAHLASLGRRRVAQGTAGAQARGYEKRRRAGAHAPLAPQSARHAPASTPHTYAPPCGTARGSATRPGGRACALWRLAVGAPRSAHARAAARAATPKTLLRGARRCWASGDGRGGSGRDTRAVRREGECCDDAITQRHGYAHRAGSPADQPWCRWAHNGVAGLTPLARTP